MKELSLSFVRTSCACSTISFMTSGTTTREPDEITSCTVTPSFTSCPAAGLEEMTSPCATVEEYWVVDDEPMVRPAAVIAASACATVMPLNEGTLTVNVPWITSSVIVEPAGALCGGPGISSTTSPLMSPGELGASKLTIEWNPCDLSLALALPS